MQVAVRSLSSSGEVLMSLLLVAYGGRLLKKILKRVMSLKREGSCGQHQLSTKGGGKKEENGVCDPKKGEKGSTELLNVLI